MKYLWGTGWQARWGPWGVLLCIRVNLLWGTWPLGVSSWIHVRCSWGDIWVIPGALLCLEVVGVSLMALGMHSDSCGSLRAPVPGLLVSLIIQVELVQEGLEITLVLDDQKSSLEFLSEGQISVTASLTWWLSSSSTTRWGTVLVPGIFWLVEYPLSFSSMVFLAPPILFSALGFFPNTPFVYSSIQGGRSLV